MAAALTREQAEGYRRLGYHFPIRAFSADEASDLLERLHATEARLGGPLAGRMNQKPHLLLPWLADVIREPRILDAVEGVLGPNILCWASGFFWKPAGDPAYISWHQDSTYWGLSHPDIVTAWVAFTPSTPESGCMP